MTAHEWTAVSMRELTDAEIRAYVDTGEPLDKAGSYGAHALGAGLITRVEGCFYNVIGLPLARLLRWMMLSKGAHRRNFDDLA